MGQYGIQKNIYSFKLFSVFFFVSLNEPESATSAVSDSTPPQVTPDALGYDALVMGRKEPMRETDGSRGGGVAGWGGCWGSSFKQVGGE